MDSCFWALRLSTMTPHQKKVALAWLDAVDQEFDILVRDGRQMRALNQALVLHEDQTITWADDKRWDRVKEVAKALPGADRVGFA